MFYGSNTRGILQMPRPYNRERLFQEMPKLRGTGNSRSEDSQCTLAGFIEKARFKLRYLVYDEESKLGTTQSKELKDLGIGSKLHLT